MAAENPIRRGSTFYLYKRVPKRYAPIETRRTIWISLHTDSESAARTKAATAWQQMIEGWEASLAGDKEDAEQCFDAARELAAARGFRFMRAERVAALPMDEFQRRVEDIPKREAKADAVTAAAVLGTAAEGRQLKSAHGKRVIPLAGVSLEAFRQCPQGFPTYRCKDKISDTANKYLRENKLLETSAHSLYGLRHAFEDRMIAAGVDDRIRRDLFGHRLDREKYGKGASLDHLLRIIQSISF